MMTPRAILAVLLSAFFLAACSSGSGDEPANGTDDPASGSTWGSMKWDQDQWK